MDPVLLFRVEQGLRLPVQKQISYLAYHIYLAEDELQTKRITLVYVKSYDDGISARKALSFIQEVLGDFEE